MRTSSSASAATRRTWGVRMDDLRAQFQGMRSQIESGQSAAAAPTQTVDKPTPSPDGELVDLGGVKVDATVVDRAAQLLDQFPSLKPSSGHRDAQQNKRENGVDRSWHLKGRAVDFKGPLKDLYAAAGVAQTQGAAESLVHNGGNGMILHVAWAD